MQKLYYIEGTTQEKADLARCLVEGASSVIILSDKFAIDADKEDTQTILQAMIIKNYLNHVKKMRQSCDNLTKIQTRVCMQLLAPESIIHYSLSLHQDDVKND